MALFNLISREKKHRVTEKEIAELKNRFEEQSKTIEELRKQVNEKKADLEQEQKTREEAEKQKLKEDEEAVKKKLEAKKMPQTEQENQNPASWKQVSNAPKATPSQEWNRRKMKERLAAFYEVHKNEMPKEEWNYLADLFAEYDNHDPSWNVSADAMKAAYRETIWVYHDESVDRAGHIYLTRCEDDVTGVTWQKSSDWPCAEMAVMRDEKIKKGSGALGSGYKIESYYEILLRDLCHMSGIWRFERYAFEER